MTESKDEYNVSQNQENVLQNINIQGSSNIITFAPTQNTVIETQIIQISAQKVTQQPLIKSSPYKGLNRFNAADRDRFYGRDKLIKRLLDAINISGLILVTGASGSGKSSVIRAGVIPELKQSLSDQALKDFIFTPSQDPFESLYRCLLNEEKDYQFSESDAQIVLNKKADSLQQLIERLKGSNERWLWFIDQFEEIFTNCGDETIRQNFIEAIVKIVKSGNGAIRIILGMRADFLEQFSFYPALGTILDKDNIHLVTEMHPDELRQAIEQPAAKHGVVFETGLVEQIIQDVRGQRGYLPLLQYSLNLLWETESKTQGTDGRAQIENRTLNISTYNQLEGVRGALQSRVDKLYRNLSVDERSFTKQIFLKLVNIVDTEGGSRPVSRRANQSEFVGKELEQKLLSSFVKENLLVSSTEYQNVQGLDFKGTAGKKQFATVEIAHEVLLSSWDELKRWLEEEKETIILKNYLADETNRWQRIRQEHNQAKARAELLKGARLEQLYTLREAKAFEKLGGLSNLENEFIDASFAWSKQQESQVKRRRQITIGALSSFLVIVSGLALIAQKNAYEANKANVNQGFIANSYKMTSLLYDNLQIEALLEAVQTESRLQQEPNNSLASSDTKMRVALATQEVIYNIKEKNRLTDHSRDVSTVAYSPDGKYIATGSYDTTVKLWDVNGKKLHTFAGHKDVVTSVAFANDSQYIASASIDRTVKIWNIESKEVKSFDFSEGINSVAFSPDGKQLAITSGKEIFLIALSNGEKLQTLKGHSDEVLNATFSPDGKQLATASVDKTIKIWSNDGKELQTLRGHSGEVTSVVFSTDGKQLASASADNTVKLWNLEGKELFTLKGHSDKVTAVVYAPNGKSLASASLDKTVKLWSTEGKELQTFKGHSEIVRSLAFAIDGKSLASASGDKTVKIWNVDGMQVLTLKGHSKGIRNIAYAPDSQKIVSASADKTMKIWSNDGKELKTLLGHAQVVRSVAFAPDGKKIASASSDDTIKIWDSEGKELQTITGHSSVVNAIAFSPDGQYLASASLDMTVKLWNMEGKEVQSISDNIGEIFSITFSPDSKQLVLAGKDKTVRIWNIQSKTLQTLGQHTERINSVAFSNDGKYIASASADKTIKIWSREGKELRTLKGHNDAIASVAFSPNSQQLVSASADRIIKVWNIDGAEIYTLKGHNDAISNVIFANNGQQLASASNDGTVILWNIDLASLKGLGCNLLQDYILGQTNIGSEDTVYVQTICKDKSFKPKD
ncbi:PD40 domain-containing protein [Pseudanabaena sp. FACHB-1998]|uniref:nSTAND1 domain-containing NTPase n=1 Tax=Pseudanabaena sp. FACHB-1998 TaxID=2692858 RepID=UPI0016800BB3|nr:AAA family ATPase [Pseudanabaena sp. FACHB-1998]MBD2179179.1 PD40 domain-containing protein [Pseudanabaena sp. FACHB-1998]